MCFELDPRLTHGNLQAERWKDGRVREFARGEGLGKDRKIQASRFSHRGVGAIAGTDERGRKGGGGGRWIREEKVRSHFMRFQVFRITVGVHDMMELRRGVMLDDLAEECAGGERLSDETNRREDRPDGRDQDR